MPRSRFAHLKPEILRLRGEGLSYSEIQAHMGITIPKSTLSNWCSTLFLSSEARDRLSERMASSDVRKMKVALFAKQRREKRHQEIIGSHLVLSQLLSDIDIAKIALVMLYLGEGRKNERKAVFFGNSNPNVIRLFLRLFFKVYSPNIAKFRIRIQARADQDIFALEEYWKKIIDVPGLRFYPTWKDARTVGKPTCKPDYMGVCTVGYLDTRIQLELVVLGRFLSSMGR